MPSQSDLDNIFRRTMVGMKTLLVMSLLISETYGKPLKPISSGECGIPGTIKQCTQDCNCGCFLEVGSCVSCDRCNASQPSCWDHNCRHYKDSELYLPVHIAPAPRPTETTPEMSSVLAQTTQQNSANLILVIVLSSVAISLLVIAVVLTFYLCRAKCSKKENRLRQIKDEPQTVKPSSPASECCSLVSQTELETGEMSEDAEMETSFMETGKKQQGGQMQRESVPSLAAEASAVGSSDRGHDCANDEVESQISRKRDKHDSDDASDEMYERKLDKEKRQTKKDSKAEDVNPISLAGSDEATISETWSIDQQEASAKDDKQKMYSHCLESRSDNRSGIYGKSNSESFGIGVGDHRNSCTETRETSDSSKSHLRLQIFPPAANSRHSQEEPSTHVKVPSSNGSIPGRSNNAVHTSAHPAYDLSVNSNYPVSQMKFKDSFSRHAGCGFSNQEQNLPSICRPEGNRRSGGEEQEKWQRRKDTQGNI